MSPEVVIAPEVRNGLTVYPFTHLRQLGVDAFFTDRRGGVSLAPYDTLNLGSHVGDDFERVLENRRRVALAADVEKLSIIDQIHGSDVVNLDSEEPLTRGDALTTTQPDVALAILVADCVPIVLADQERILVIHAGWRGLASDIIAKSVPLFREPRNVLVGIGPRVSPEVYQVDSETAGKFSPFPEAILPDEPGHARLDLAAIAQLQLINSGVHSENIHACAQVTDGGNLFFSDRAARPCGRFALIATRKRATAG